MAIMDREQLVRLDLDTSNNLIGRVAVHIGIIGSGMICARDIWLGVIPDGVIKIIIAAITCWGVRVPHKKTSWPRGG